MQIHKKALTCATKNLVVVNRHSRLVLYLLCSYVQTAFVIKCWYPGAWFNSINVFNFIQFSDYILKFFIDFVYSAIFKLICVVVFLQFCYFIFQYKLL